MGSKLIVTLVGPIACGKGAAVKVFLKHGYLPIVFSHLIDKALTQKGMVINRVNEGTLANEMRQLKGKDYWANLAYDTVASLPGERFVIDGTRNVEELDTLRKMGVKVIAIDAPQAVRFKRLVARKDGRDVLDFNTFKQWDDRERLGDPQDPNFTIQIEKAMRLADYKVDNSGTLLELENKLIEIINKLS